MESKKINQLATEMSPAATDITIIGDPITGVSKKITLEQISSLFGGTVSFYTNYASFPATGEVDVIYCAKDTKKLYLWSGSAYVEVFPSQALLDTYQLRSEKGNANGYASLDGSGKVPSAQLPSYVDDVIEVANYAALPVTGETGKIYITLDNNKVYRWTGSVYVEIAANNAIWGSITGTLSNQTDLQTALNAKVPTSRTLSINGTSYDLSANRTWSVGTVTSVAVTESVAALSITGSPITTSGTINIGFAGASTEYVAGDGSLVTFPTLLSSDNLIKQVRNQSGATMTAGTIVYISGATGNKPLISKALATGDSTSAQTYGLLQTNIANNADGYVVVIGNVSNLDTSALTEGQQLYLSGTTAGTYTTTKPYAPIHLVYVGIVLRSHPTMGIIGVKIQNGYEMDELHNVDAYLPNNNDILSYNTTTSLWEHKQIATTLGFTPISLSSLNATTPLSYNNTTGAFTISQATTSTNGYLSSTDWNTFNSKGSGSVTSVALSAPTGFSVTGSPINTTGTLALAFATGYSLPTNASQTNWDTAYTNRITSATSPLSITSNVISISQASGSTSGYLSSTDWTTFNNKQSALTNPVTGTGTSGQVTYFNGTSSVTGSNNFKFDGTNLTVGNPTSALAQWHVYNASGAATMLLQTNSTTDYSEIAVRNDSSTATSYFRQYSTAATGSDFGISRAGLALFFSNYATNFAIGTRNGGNLIFGTADTERARILASNGYFGIGTASPSSLLTVNGDISIGYNNALILGASPYRYKIYRSNAGSLETYFDDEYDISSTALNFRFRTSGTPITALRIVSTGAATFSGSLTSSGLTSTSNIIVSAGFGILVGGGGFAIGPSATRGIIGINGSGDQLLTFSTQSYIYNSSSLFRMLSSSDIDFVAGGTQRLLISASTGAATFSSSVGIATSSPAQTLDVNGTIQISGSGNWIKYDTATAFFGSASTISGGTASQLGIRSGSDILFATGGATERMRITSTGRCELKSEGFVSQKGASNSVGSGSFIAVQQTGATEKWILQQLNASYGLDYWAYNGTTWSVIASINASTGVYTPLSDINKKKDFENSTIGLNAILGLKPTLYRMKTDSEDSDKQLGFIAQEVKEFIPQAYVEQDDFIGLNDRPIIAALVKAIQELEARLKTLENK